MRSDVESQRNQPPKEPPNMVGQMPKVLVAVAIISLLWPMSK